MARDASRSRRRIGFNLGHQIDCRAVTLTDAERIQIRRLNCLVRSQRGVMASQDNKHIRVYSLYDASDILGVLELR